jgi:hypothetical protein
VADDGATDHMYRAELRPQHVDPLSSMWCLHRAGAGAAMHLLSASHRDVACNQMVRQGGAYSLGGSFGFFHEVCVVVG